MTIDNISSSSCKHHQNAVLIKFREPKKVVYQYCASGRCFLTNSFHTCTKTMPPFPNPPPQFSNNFNPSDLYVLLADASREGFISGNLAWFKKNPSSLLKFEISTAHSLIPMDIFLLKISILRVLNKNLPHNATK